MGDKTTPASFRERHHRLIWAALWPVRKWFTHFPIHRGKGVLIRKDAKPAVEPMGRCLADVMRRIEADDPLIALCVEAIDRLVNWDAEKYRQGLNAGT